MEIRPPISGRISTAKLAGAAAAVIALSLLAYLAAPDPARAPDAGPWYSVLPPLLAVTLAIVTGKIVPSLAIAIVIGGILNTVPEAPLSAVAWAKGIFTGGVFIYDSATSWFNLQILIFVVFVLAMIATVIVAGGLQGVVQWLSRFAKGPRSAQFVTFLMGLAVFIDDYANTMIVGASMRPVTDAYRISREKLSFLVDSTSAPVAGLAVVSTWVGYEVSLFQKQVESLGLEKNGYAILFDALPYRFYCVLMLLAIAISLCLRRDFGPMLAAERRARRDGMLGAEDAVPMTSAAFSTASPDSHARIRALTAVIPIGFLFVFLMAGIWIDGGGWAVLRGSPASILHFTTWRDVISASENSVLILAIGSGFSLVIGFACALAIAKLDIQTAGSAALSGARSSILPIVILILAWSIKEACDSLGTGTFLVAAVGDSVPPMLFPAITFAIAGVTAFCTGTSYGTMAILMPTAAPIAYHLGGDSYGLVMIVTLGAILDGAILGDHCSPISDTTIMSSISSSADHLHHVRTQLPYSVSVALAALFCGYLPAGAGLPSWIGILLGIAVIAAGLALFGRTAEEPPRAGTGEDA